LKLECETFCKHFFLFLIIKDLEFELTQQQNSFGEFNNAAQCVAQTLDEESPAIQQIQHTMEDFNNRWNTIASMLNTKMKHVSVDLLEIVFFCTFPVGKIIKKNSLKECVFVSSALKIQCHVVKNTL